MNAEKLSEIFLKEPNELNAINLLIKVIEEQKSNLAIILAEYFENLYPDSFVIKDQYGLTCFYSGKYEKSYDIYKKCLDMKNLNEPQIQHIINNQNFSIKNIIINRFFNIFTNGRLTRFR